jgi:hypothetical protein
MDIGGLGVQGHARAMVGGRPALRPARPREATARRRGAQGRRGTCAQRRQAGRRGGVAILSGMARESCGEKAGEDEELTKVPFRGRFERRTAGEEGSAGGLELRRSSNGGRLCGVDFGWETAGMGRVSGGEGVEGGEKARGVTNRRVMGV